MYMKKERKEREWERCSTVKPQETVYRGTQSDAEILPIAMKTGIDTEA